MVQPSVAIPAIPVEAPSAPQLSIAPKPAPKSSPFIFGPVRDTLFIIGSPVLILALYGVLSLVPPGADQFKILGTTASLVVMLSVGFNHSHLFAVVFRSHVNRKVFAEFPLRFTLVPIALFVATALSNRLLVFAILVAAVWDVYHSSMQIFGLARIYDSKAGVKAESGRSLDIWMAHALYIGPIIGGANLMYHLNFFKGVNEVGSHLFDFIPAYGESHQVIFTSVGLSAVVVYVGYYVFATVRRARRGEPVAWTKVALLTTTGVVSVWAWGFNAFGKAFTIMNVFHALQYFAIVWWAEGKGLQKKLGVEGHKLGPALVLGGILGLSLAYGIGFAWGLDYWAPHTSALRSAAIALVNTIALMHFWYDGFVWSVRKKAVPA